MEAAPRCPPLHLLPASSSNPGLTSHKHPGCRHPCAGSEGGCGPRGVHAIQLQHPRLIRDPCVPGGCHALHPGPGRGQRCPTGGQELRHASGATTRLCTSLGHSHSQTITRGCHALHASPGRRALPCLSCQVLQTRSALQAESEKPGCAAVSWESSSGASSCSMCI